MASAPGVARGSPAAARTAAAFAGLVIILLVLSSVPLLLSPPVGLALRGPSILPAEAEVRFEGRFSLAGIGMGGALVEVYLDDEVVLRTTTAPDGAFAADIRAPLGAHTLRATAAPGAYTEAHTVPLAFRAVDAPDAPREVRVEAGTVRWTSPADDADRPVQEYRVYAQTGDGPWTELAALPPGVTSHALDGATATRVAVAAANVAGESTWTAAAV